MALEQVFFDPRALKRFRAGPLASKLDGFCEWLSKHGFARCTIRSHISNVSHFSLYLEQQKLKNPTSFYSDHVRRFITEHLPHCKHRRPGAKHYHRVAFSIHRFIEYLQEDGMVDTPHYYATPYQTVMDEYINWLKDYYSLAPGTLMLRKQYLVQFLDWLGPGSITQQLLTLSPDQVETFFLNYSQSHGRAARRSMQASLRTFFRFCFVRSYTLRDFAEIVPTLRAYKLDKIPRGVNEEDAQRLLSSINRNNNTGRRD